MAPEYNLNFFQVTFWKFLILNQRLSAKSVLMVHDSDRCCKNPRLLLTISYCHVVKWPIFLLAFETLVIYFSVRRHLAPGWCACCCQLACTCFEPVSRLSLASYAETYWQILPWTNFAFSPVFSCGVGAPHPDWCYRQWWCCPANPGTDHCSLDRNRAHRGGARPNLEKISF